jgi:hypothetical protein
MSSSTRIIAAAFPPVVAMALASACVQTQRALGEDCLKDQDCLSGICSQLQCAAAPPLLQGTPQAPPAEAGSDVGVEAGVDSASPGPDAPADVAAETTPSGDDSAPDAPSE